MSQYILLTGSMSKKEEINLLWSDGNNVRHGSRISIYILEILGDRKQTLIVEVNDIIVATVDPSGSTREWAEYIGELI